MTPEQLKTINLIKEIQAPYIEEWNYANDLLSNGKSLLKTHPNLAFGCMNRSYEIKDKIKANYRAEIEATQHLTLELMEEDISIVFDFSKYL